MNNFKQLIAICVIGLTILIAFGLPKPKYQSLNILKQLNIPASFGEWTSTDSAKTLDLNSDSYKFVSDIFARTYTRKDGAGLLFLILDAGNFHNPKVCFGGAGYQVKEMDDEVFLAGGRILKATTLSVQKPREGYVLMYWLCLDKKFTSWTSQKVKEFWTSIIGKKKAGLMVRLDIPSSDQSTTDAIALGKQFITDLSQSLSTKELDYLFGK